ncbi:MAG: hypothetical protein R2695_06845 [Acidimicrobiales bacterium]
MHRVDVRWEERQRAFQARVMTSDEPDLELRPYRTFVGPALAGHDRRTTRAERLVVAFTAATVTILVLLAAGVPREITALTAGFAGGALLVLTVARPDPNGRLRRPRTTEPGAPLLAVYAPTVLVGMAPVCVTRISGAELDRLGREGFATVVGAPRPGSTFGVFVDNHLVWPQTPPRPPVASDPGFGAS